MWRYLVVTVLLNFSLLAAFRVGVCGEHDSHMSSDEVLVISEAGKDWVSEKTGEFIPLDERFVNEDGQAVRLGDFIDRPTLILPIYFYCPTACSTNLANMAVAMNRLKFDPGRHYRAIALSFSDTENADNARRAKQNYIKLLYDDFPADEWTFLTGSREAIAAVTDAMGYRFKRMKDHTFLHPSAIIAVDGEGKIIRYIYGSFIPGDIDLAISGAMEGKPSMSVKRFLEFCLDYDPDQNKSVFQLVKVVVLLIFAVGIAIFLLLAGKRRKQAGRET